MTVLEAMYEIDRQDGFTKAESNFSSIKADLFTECSFSDAEIVPGKEVAFIALAREIQKELGFDRAKVNRLFAMLKPLPTKGNN